MKRSTGLWIVRLSETATRDFHSILGWTAARFGDSQAQIYEQTLTAAIDALAVGPERLRAKGRKELPAGFLTLHVARKGRRGSHVLLLRTTEGPNTVEVVRILHESMDIARHIPPADE